LDATVSCTGMGIKFTIMHLLLRRCPVISSIFAEARKTVYPVCLVFVHKPLKLPFGNH